MNKTLKAVVGKLVLLFAVGSFIYRQCQVDDPKRLYQGYLDWGYKGVVTKKYIDRDNHAHRTVDFLPDDPFTMQSSIDLELRHRAIGLDDLYDYLQPGDTLQKMRGDSVIRVSNGDARGRFFVGRPHDW
jgi:hypothetical protein